ncbi:hypothetical protein E9993_17825 [Labilibacter sediminis]|nr:hypothetical protein E9993_17825 [Labilibacter sediminis]
MRKYSLTCMMILLILPFISCEKDSNDIEPNTSPILVGELIGDNLDHLSELWKVGEVLLGNDSEDYHIDKMYFTRPQSTSEYVYWIIPIRNVSDSSHIFIKATDMKFLDIADNMLDVNDLLNFTYVHGSNAKVNHSLVSTNAFLRPNELGYFVGLDRVSFDNVAKISIESIKHSVKDFSYLDINVIPTSYQMKSNNLNVFIKNLSNKDVRIMESLYLMLNRNNVPIYWGYLDPSDYFLPAESSINMSADIFYNGECYRIQPMLEFELLTNNTALETLKAFTTESNENNYRCFLRKRNMRLNEITATNKP